VIHPARKYTYDHLATVLPGNEAAGWVRSQKHPTHPLTIWCYTKECQQNGNWNEYTRMARGLVLDDANHRIVATPFPKFFNYGEATGGEETELMACLSVPNLPFEVFDKMDGSLIILFHYFGKWHAATKGSFTSPQALWATAKLAQYDLTSVPQGFTLLCEAIYPDNRIVVPYDREALVLLAGYAAEPSCVELTRDEMINIAAITGMPLVERRQFPSISHLLEAAKVLPATEEGWVLRFSNGYRLKIKGDEYCRLHRFVSGITPLNLWREMRAGNDLNALRLQCPEEFWKDFDSILSILAGQRAYWRELIAATAIQVSEWTNKELGLRLKTLPTTIQSFMFLTRKNGSNPHAWGEVACNRFYDLFKPKGNHLEGYRASNAMVRVMDSE
jgi:RNA ligase